MMGTPDTDEAVVSAAMAELARTPADARPLPDPSFIWWKAQLLRRFDAQRKAAEPIEIGDRMHVGGAVLGAVALAAGAWPYVASVAAPPTAVLAAAVGVIVCFSALTFAAWEHTRK